MIYRIRRYTLVPPLPKQGLHAARKIRSSAFISVVSSTGRASTTAVCCMDEVSALVCSFLGNIHHSGSNPHGCIHPSSNFSTQNPPTQTAPIVGPICAFLANPAIAHCLLVSFSEVVQVEWIKSTQNHPFIPPQRCTSTTKSFISWTERTGHLPGVGGATLKD